MLTGKTKKILLLLILVCINYTCSNRGQSARNIILGTTTDSNEPVIYLALGDSTGAGLGAQKGGGYPERLLARIKRTHPNARLINQSKSGATTADVLREQIPAALDPPPTIITIGVGLNDLLQGIEVEKFAHDLEQVAVKATALGGQTIFTTLPDLSLAPGLPRNVRENIKRRLLSFNERIKEIAQRHNARLVDLYEATTEQAALREGMFSADGIHPSDEGYEFWAETIWTTTE